jgi:chromosome segregation ATPase
MTEKTKNRKDRNFILWFLRLFPSYRKLERTLNERAAIIESIKWDRDRYRKKIESDTNVINSLNRYIEALETKAAYLADMLADLKKRLEEIIAKKT